MARGETRRRGVVIGFVAAALAVVATPLPAAAQESVTDAARELAERHVPVIMLQEQPTECSEEGEPYLPMPVDAILDNPEIALRQGGPDGLVALWGPSAADLHRFGPNFFLDFPGSALDPGCAYERDLRRYLDGRGLGPAVYAHVATSPDEPGVIALQYWFYFYFNDWNNKHESDWEGIQLLFRADSVDEALLTEPYSVGYAQHTGGERADWDDDKLERDELRPVVYTSMRSHASYFTDAIYLGRGASEGFGCDDTTGPSTRVDPEVVVLPDSVEDPDDPLAWLAFEGRWGERHQGAYDSPTGLLAKARWHDPVAWHEQLRDSSVTVPAGESGAAGVIDAFCGVVKWGSGQALLVQISPLRVLLTVALAVALVRFALGRTRWERVDPSPVVRRRRAGQLARASLERFRAEPLVFLGIGLLALPAIALAGLVVAGARALPLIGPLLDLSDTGGGSRVVLSAVAGGIANSIAFVFVVAGVAWALDRSDGGDRADVGGAVRATRARAGSLAAAVAVGFVVTAALVSTVVLAPIAAWLVVRWQLAAPVIALERAGAVDGLRRSAALTRRRWWHTFLVTGLVNLVVAGAGTVVALLVLTVFNSLPLWSTTVVVAAVSAVVLPLGAIAISLLYGDAVAQRSEAHAEAPSEVVPVDA